MTRGEASEEENEKLGIKNNLVADNCVFVIIKAFICFFYISFMYEWMCALQIRLSIGLEEVNDLIEDLSQALKVKNIFVLIQL